MANPNETHGPENGLYADFSKVVRAEGEKGAIARLIANTDSDFYKHHPELRGKRLSGSSAVDLQQEWRNLYLAHSRAALAQLRLDASIVDIGA
jgi:hypothetical protein